MDVGAAFSKNLLYAAVDVDEVVGARTLVGGLARGVTAVLTGGEGGVITRAGGATSASATLLLEDTAETLAGNVTSASASLLPEEINAEASKADAASAAAAGFARAACLLTTSTPTNPRQIASTQTAMGSRRHGDADGRSPVHLSPRASASRIR